MIASTYDASFWTEVLILLAWGGTIWYTFLTFKQSGHATRKAAWLTGFILLWSIWAFGATKYELDTKVLPAFPPRPVYYLLPAIVLTTLFRKQLLGTGLDQRWLIGLQFVRPIGMLFVLEWYRGNLPGIFAHPAGWGDLFAGLVALYVFFRYRGQPFPSHAIWLVFCVGMLDFASAIFFGVTSSATPLQLFSFEMPNEVLRYPTGLIPLYLVPYAVIFHLLSIFELKRAQRAAHEH